MSISPFEYTSILMILSKFDHRRPVGSNFDFTCKVPHERLCLFQTAIGEKEDYLDVSLGL